jgi:hypothetical protein
MPDRAGWENRGPNRPAGQGGGAPASKPGNRAPAAGSAQRPPGLGLRPIGPVEYEFVHPPGVEEMRPDFEEGIGLANAGELDEARDALRYALEGCRDNVWVHVALGKIAFQGFRDPTLARGHFGYVIELCQRAIPPNFSGRIPPESPANRPFYEAIDGLIACFDTLGQPRNAVEVDKIGARWSGRTRT